jgi:hypothetical protein
VAHRPRSSKAPVAGRCSGGPHAAGQRNDPLPGLPECLLPGLPECPLRNRRHAPGPTSRSEYSSGEADRDECFSRRDRSMLRKREQAKVGGVKAAGAAGARRAWP